ncbi:NAD(P)H-dependent oxidoreductase [Paenibacillus arenilitoris]|uniref:NAD(P)H-dependent oxidoreductase n=1 Tax=Paenibacillus arenilitoris TaxID=2772299 RepID=A0A927H5M4_9BACL|nr:NAD(P)H-dependent oxidoreductase [Paenibacillus arenilitoris]MBD2868577.1 NAD(P)H-dependent oxidoreductase [Paenibacillus arenilitoris]
MKNNIAVIIGHPNPESYCNSLAQAYKKGAVSSGANVRVIDLGKIQFDPILKYGYHKRTELEPDLVAAQETIRWADHLVFVYPNWWGSVPAILKGFFDRVLLPGFAFKYDTPTSLVPKQLLKGKTARLIVTMDTPLWYYKLFLNRANHIIMKRNILQYIGIKPVKITEFAMLKFKKKDVLEKWLRKAEGLGANRG